MYDLFVNFDLKYIIFTISEKNDLPYKPITMKNYTLFFLSNSRTGLFSNTYSKQTTTILYVDKNTIKTNPRRQERISKKPADFVPQLLGCI